MADHPLTAGVGIRETPTTRFGVHVLGHFQVTDEGKAVDLPNDAKRLVAFLALQTHDVTRTLAAGGLWMDSDQDRAFGNLRSALWRIRQRCQALVHSHGDTLGFAPDVEVDLHVVNETAAMLFHDPNQAQERDIALEPFVHELLPGWYDDWALVERERVRQQAMHALEAISDNLSRQGKYPQAIEAALACIRLDPLRESAHRCLIRIHFSEGNRSEAVRQFTQYRSLLEKDLGLSPSPEMTRLIDTVTEKVGVARR